MVCAVGWLWFRRVHSHEPTCSCCRCCRTGGYCECQGKPSELLPNVIIHLLRTKGYATPVCGGTEAKRTMPFNNNLTRQPDCGWLRGSCNCFLQPLVCNLLNGKPKEGCNRSLAHNLSQSPNPRPTRLPGSCLPSVDFRTGPLYPPSLSNRAASVSPNNRETCGSLGSCPSSDSCNA